MEYKAIYIDSHANASISHHGVKGMHWGDRRYQNPDGSLTPLGREHYGISQARIDEARANAGKNKTVFVSGSSKTQDKASGYYRKKLPWQVRDELKIHMKRGDKIIVGDAPGIDRQTQDYLAKKKYSNVEVFSPGKDGARYLANPGWKQTNVDAPGTEVGSKEWLAAKDLVMSKMADVGIAVTIDEGAKATRKNVDRLVEANKDVMVYELGKDRGFVRNLLSSRDRETYFIDGKEIPEDWDVNPYAFSPYGLNPFGNVPDHEYGTRTKEIAANKIAKDDAEGRKREAALQSSVDKLRSNGYSNEEIRGALKGSGRNTTRPKSWVEEAANDPEHWQLIDDTPGERLYKRIEPSKSSGRYKTGKKAPDEATKSIVDSARKELSKVILSEESPESRESFNRYLKTRGPLERASDKLTRFELQRTYTRSLSKAKAHMNSLRNSGYSNAEIAKMIGVSESTVSKYLNM